MPRALPAIAATLACCGALGVVVQRPAASGTVTRAQVALPGPAAQASAIASFAGSGKPIHCGGGRRNLVALTFDDGPGRYTRSMLYQLDQAGVSATYFLVGHAMQRYPRWPRQEREALAIGSHTLTHPNLTTLSLEAVRRQIAGGRAAARRGGGPADLFRPPYGLSSPAIDREIRRQGMVQIMWDVNSADSRRRPQLSSRQISARVLAHVRPGSIVLMHEDRRTTVHALRTILPELKRRGLRAVTVAQLLAADPPSAAQLAAGVASCGAGPAARR